jgi:histidine triad (HIT) family protein
MEDSIFTKIVKGEIPSHKIYEDESTLAFLDIYSITEGHTLVIPKKQVEFIWDMEDSDYAQLMASVKKVGQRLRKLSGRKYVGQVVVGTDVPHVHVHVIPFDDAEEIVRTLSESSAQADQANLIVSAKKYAF